MKQIKNPAYTKWARELRNYSMEIGLVREMPIDDRCTRIYPLPINYLTNPRYCDDERITTWIAAHPAPAKMIDDPEFVALQERINVLEKENSDMKQGIGLDMHKLLHTWHENHDALDIDDVQFVVDKLLTHMYINDTVNLWWRLDKEDEHFYTDKGLEAPSRFMGLDADYEMTNLSVYISEFKASRCMSREERYYKALDEDVERKLNKKETK